ncbi:serine/threonine protein kinase [Sphaerisporangium album]|uniref:non-specific serine/threonine protein kinase n=1 Tax=Sphaerisporangium album TaxID=509200 RepID=A0A367FAS4_9ACTN|nr:serine/threonine-protein kinase [Sphaerisporangium album]RCG26795.1 serine/threonine protein kinase [Sphaerisporangium album]
MGEPGAPEVPGYEVLGILGQGGFGVVYRARQLAVRREVALKVDNRVLVSERDRRRFMREVSSAGALSGHPHVADVYDAGVLGDGRPYMVLELCPGGSLSDRLREQGPLSPAEVRDIGVRIADALAAAHTAGVLHRDVKPANILVNGYGMVALSDFGLAATAHTEGEMSVTRESLTPAFGPPEAFELAEPSPAGDVYSLSATLYALLSGRPPRFPESGVVNVAMIMALHRRPVPEIPGVAPELTAVLRAGMAADPRERIPSAADLRDALAAIPAAVLPGRPGHSGRSGSGGPSVAYQVAQPSHPGPAAQPGHPGHSGPLSHPAPHGHSAPLPHASAPGHSGPYERPPQYSRPAARSAPSAPPAHSRHSAPTGPSRRHGDGPDRGGRPSPREAVTGPSARAVSSTLPPHTPKQNAHTGAYVAVAGVFALLLTIGTALALHEGATPDAATTMPASAPPATGAGVGTGLPSGGLEPTAGAVATVTANCPAASVAAARAACSQEAECWGGIVSIAGSVTVKRRGCEEAHSWETFAVAPMPVDGITYDLQDLEAHPVVKKLCSMQVLLKSRQGVAREISPSKWMVSALPPSPEAFKEGVRVYRCVGGVMGSERPGTYFRPLS